MREHGSWPGFDAAQLEQYLALGYVPDADGPDPLRLLARWTRRPRRDPATVSEQALVTEGVRALRAAVEQAASAAGTRGDQVVFLSGGLDSRTILGSLLEIFDRSEILAVTFGRPGEQDFDFAARVATVAGVRHETLGSAGVEWTTQGLVDSVLARQIPLPFPFGQRYLSYLLHARVGPDNVFWDGLCGDEAGDFRTPVAGEEWTWTAAVDEFLETQLLPDWQRLARPGFDPRSAMPSEPWFDDDTVYFYDQLEFGILARSNTGTRLLRDYTICTPFLSQAWLDFCLSLPTRYRQKAYLYQEIQKQALPTLFSLPVTTYGGGAVLEPSFTRRSRNLRRRVVGKAGRMGVPLGPLGRAPAPAGANAAIRAAYRHPGPIRDLVESNLADLADRGVLDWIDVAAVLPGVLAPARYNPGRHTGVPASDSVITRLLGLEINLKAVEQHRSRPGS
ncbi:asparagine synthase-related protein [Pengzhenrongella frigida]|uniref:Asparagine synthetase domain-containing protein n=1 Tax=Pengzhenrongella frigida TaxID=1259133 RepID=A0A4Q5MY80_9MICO|nr:asparagine synthase-related protein [Cellulomonas sp. HLT2-17]RYV50648.1 hypothetical protein EUA98_12395 [Cellulomonas sp. HLT2-17]